MSDRSAKNGDALAEGFMSPPDDAKPRVWWHWINGNISKEGIEKDLQWMQRIGVGGLQNFDGALGTEQIVERRIPYMSPEWREAFAYAVDLADRMGLEFAVASSPGWSETGGPWVAPSDGMKKLVWSESRLFGGRRFEGRLPSPPTISGPFQSMPHSDPLLRHRGEGLQFYQDVAVMAYRTPRSFLQAPPPIRVTASAPGLDARPLLNDDLANGVSMPIDRHTPAWVLYDFGGPQRMRSFSIARRPAIVSSTIWVVEAGDDGTTFHEVAEAPTSPLAHHTTVTFPAVTARYWRLTIRAGAPRGFIELGANAPRAEIDAAYAKSMENVALYKWTLYPGARTHRFEEKAGFSIAMSYYGMESATSEADEVVDPGAIVDLTGRMHPDGALEWTPPDGDWTVLRLGYSLTGKTNHPASPEATGLEVDKLNRNAVRAYAQTYLNQFERAIGADRIGARGVRAFLTDSIEAAGQNWTSAMADEFRTRRGYDLTVWLPALTGVIIGDAERTDRFLWDFRKTLMELMSEAHYGELAACAHQRGLTYYSESLEGYPFMALGDDLDMRAPADIPMAAVWTNFRSSDVEGVLSHLADMRGAASVAHVLGKSFVAAESLTSAYEPWAFSPATLRPFMDLAFALGVNRPVIHTSVHQPIEKKPGLTLGPYGQHFSRHETWAEFAGAWIGYLTRCSYLLQQGRHCADMAYLYGEEGPLASLYVGGVPADLPQSYDFDFVSANMLRHHLHGEDGVLAASGGARYRLLYIGAGCARMTLDVLRWIKSLSDQGVAIAGTRPQGSPSLADHHLEAEYQSLVAQLWDAGRVSSAGPDAALADLGVAPDFEYVGADPDAYIMFLHRRLTEGDIYFLTNRKSKTARIDARFRVKGRAAELWRADTGAREPLSWRADHEHTVVQLTFEPHQSLFVVFRESTHLTSEEVPEKKTRILSTLDGRWDLRFESGRGAPEHLIVDTLTCWTRHEDAGVRYFSGVCTYRQTFDFKGDLAAEEQAVLDLGQVFELAEVTLNDESMGVAWHPPFRLNVTSALRRGENKIEIRVANLWVNRLIGDKQVGAAPVAFTTIPTYQADAPLRRSGLLGPVTVLAERRQGEAR